MNKQNLQLLKCYLQIKTAFPYNFIPVSSDVFHQWSCCWLMFLIRELQNYAENITQLFLFLLRCFMKVINLNKKFSHKTLEKLSEKHELKHPSVILTSSHLLLSKDFLSRVYNNEQMRQMSSCFVNNTTL